MKKCLIVLALCLAAYADTTYTKVDSFTIKREITTLNTVSLDLAWLKKQRETVTTMRDAELKEIDKLISEAVKLGIKEKKDK